LKNTHAAQRDLRIRLQPLVDRTFAQPSNNDEYFGPFMKRSSKIVTFGALLLAVLICGLVARSYFTRSSKEICTSKVIQTFPVTGNDISIIVTNALCDNGP
jgi:hypothetical protein